MPKQDSNETSDLMEWVQNAIARLDQDIYIRPKPRIVGVIARPWRTDKNGAHFTFAMCNSRVEPVFVHENSFVRGLSYSDFTEGNSLSFELQEREGKYSGWKVADPRYEDSERLNDFYEETARNLVVRIRRGLYFPVIQVWRDGRSISDEECPKEFADAIHTHVASLAALRRESAVPESVLCEIQFLLACMHKDVPNDCVQWIADTVKGSNIRNPRVAGYALGSVSEQWQEELLLKLVEHRTFGSLRVFAYAIWREKHFVEKFNFAQLQSILGGLAAMLDNIIQTLPSIDEKDNWSVRSRVRAVAEPLELLLGLLRTRASTNSEIKMLLQPHQKITKDFATQIERVAEIVARSNVPIFSRVQINIQKPEGDRRTPDLLYALRLFLTGDDGANAIHITSVSDSDND